MVGSTNSRLHRIPFFSTPIHTNSVPFLNSCKRPAPVRDLRLEEGPQQVFRDLDFPYLKLRIRDLKAKSERDSVLKLCVGGGMPNNNPRDYGIERNCGSGLRD